MLVSDDGAGAAAFAGEPASRAALAADTLTRNLKFFLGFIRESLTWTCHIVSTNFLQRFSIFLGPRLADPLLERH